MIDTTMPLDELLERWRPGSREWSWDEEYDDLWFDPERLDRTYEVAADVLAEGIKEPILLGSDGRVWDGHHRIVVAMRFGITRVPVDQVAGQ